MVARTLTTVAAADFLQMARRVRDQGAVRWIGTIVAVSALITGEIWILDLVTRRLLDLPPPAHLLGKRLLTDGLMMVNRLAMVVATASAVTFAIEPIAHAETDPWWAGMPLRPWVRATRATWKVFAALAWVALLALPVILALDLRLGVGQPVVFMHGIGFTLELGMAAVIGVLIAAALSALVPRRVLVPLAWTGSTAAVVGAVVWLRRLQPEKLITADDPIQLLAMLRELEGPRTTGTLLWPPALPDTLLQLTVLATTVVLTLAAVCLLWRWLGPRAAIRLAYDGPSTTRPNFVWRLLDPSLSGGPARALIASRLRLLARDTTQSAQTLYLLGLGVVYVENLRALPLGDPLATELAGMLNLGMAGLLAAALSLRFAYPALLLEGAGHWWWTWGPVSPIRGLAAVATVSALPSLLLSGGLFTAAALVTGPTYAGTVAWWLIPWQVAWLTVLGVGLGPDPRGLDHRSWIDAALGGGGLGYLALATTGVLWTLVAAGRSVIATVLNDLGADWDPGFLLGSPLVPTIVCTIVAIAVAVGHARNRTSFE